MTRRCNKDFEVEISEMHRDRTLCDKQHFFKTTLAWRTLTKLSWDDIFGLETQSQLSFARTHRARCYWLGFHFNDTARVQIHPQIFFAESLSQQTFARESVAFPKFSFWKNHSHQELDASMVCVTRTLATSKTSTTQQKSTQKREIMLRKNMT